ncbi:MAG: hypothetical protein Tsb0014_11210 [Pleurocapsa sp.]
MSDKNPQPPQKINLGRTNKSIPGTPPQLARGAGQIGTNWQDINWTPRKRITVISVLAFPYTIITIACFAAGINFVAYVFLGLAVLIGLLVLIVYLINKNDL